MIFKDKDIKIGKRGSRRSSLFSVADMAVRFARRINMWYNVRDNNERCTDGGFGWRCGIKQVGRII